LVAIDARQPSDDATRHQHAIGENTRDLPAPNGQLVFGAVTVDGTTVPNAWNGWAGDGLRVNDDTATLTYDLTVGNVVLSARPFGPGTDRPIPVAVDPATANTAIDGKVTIILNRTAVVGQVVATLDRFPTVDGRFAIVDGPALGRLIDLSEAGAGQPIELWLQATPSVLDTVHLDGVDTARRDVIERRLRTDPVARGASALLFIAAALTLAVAMSTLVLLVVTERHDDAGQLFAWEADGVQPAVLRRSLWWRAAAVALPAVTGGAIIGIALSRLAARLVQITASATDAVPPLVPTGAGIGALLVAAGTVLTLGVAALVAATSFRESLPKRGAVNG
jgi:hypothetical protein